MASSSQFPGKSEHLRKTHTRGMRCGIGGWSVIKAAGALI